MKIVDLHHYRGPYVYVGRLIPFHKSLGKLEGSPLGNPFKVKDYGGEKCLKLYREWLFAQIKNCDKHTMSLMRLIDTETTLGCWCCDKKDEAIFADPEVCHAQIIWKAWRYMKGTNVI